MRNNLKKYCLALAYLVSAALWSQKVTFLDAENKEPVSFATISFGNGLGTFANANGEFTFDAKRYSDVDSIFVSGMGYKQLDLETKNLEETYLLERDIDELQEVIVTAPKTGKFKKREYKPISHADYFKSWLPTVESEVAVYFKRFEEKSTQITALLLPVNTKEEFHGKTGRSRPFSTLLRIKFYENKNQSPGREIPYGTIVFQMDQNFEKEVFELDISSLNIFIPENGIFVSVQVLGAADPEGNLIETKKYNEIKTPEGIQKVSITFRPLLPFTNENMDSQTFVRRIFFNDKKWQIFNFDYNPNSKLLRDGYSNYGMGAKLHVYN